MTRPDKAPHLLIAAGGTGGHIYPGLAVAHEVIARHPDAELTFVGTPRGLEGELVGKAGFRIEMLRVEPLRGGSLRRKLKGVVALLPALRDASRLLRRERPDAVVGVGGYLSGPILLSASLKGIPTLILEPNFEPGLANKWLARFIDSAAVAWAPTAEHFRGKAFVSGNPVRAEICAVPEVNVGAVFNVLLFGGSQGSRPLNDAMIAALPFLKSTTAPNRDTVTEAPRIHLTHQTGPGDLDRVRAAYAEHGIDGRVEPYLDDMAREYTRAAIIVSRSGATTCAELTAAGRGAVLVPLELAGGHQRHNAEALESEGAAIVVAQSELTGKRLADTLRELATEPNRCTEMGARARSLARPDAAARIVDRLDELMGMRRRVPVR